MLKYKKALPAAVFLAFIYACFVINLLTPDRVFSENENRALVGAPEIRVRNFFTGKFMTDYESYVTDQFFARDIWVGARAYMELALGKTDVNGVFVGKDGVLIEKFDAPDTDRVLSNAGYVERFAQNAGIPVYFTLIPGAVELWADRLPENAQNASQAELIARIIQNTPSAEYIDTYGVLSAHSDEEIYYKTDHHWTTLGAYYGWSALAKAMGLPVGDFPAPYLERGGFYGTASSAAGLRPGEGDTVSLAVKIPEGVSATAYEADGEKPVSIYELDRLDTKDKYTVFFGGNFPLAVIKTGNPGQKLLVIKDSYANCELPFMLSGFSQIHVLDLRYYKRSISEYIAGEDIETVLVSYSVANFVTDTNLLFLTK